MGYLLISGPRSDSLELSFLVSFYDDEMARFRLRLSKYSWIYCIIKERFYLILCYRCIIYNF
jgi:hypothetical protein